VARKSASTDSKSPLPYPNKNHEWWSISFLVGTLSGPPTTRSVASGDVSEVDLRTARWGDMASTVNVSVVGPAHYFSELTAGDEVVVLGTARRRFFRSGGMTVSRTEVEAHRVIKRSRRREVKRAISEVCEFLSSTADAQ
jgi:hypothetical protein